MATITAASDDAAEGPRSRPTRWTLFAGAAGLVAVLVGVTQCAGAGEGDRIEHVEALLPIPERFPPGWWSLDLEHESARLLAPTGSDELIGEVLRYEDGKLELGPHPDCGGGSGLYEVATDRDTVTFDVVGSDGCPPRQDVLTAGPWQRYTPPPRTTDVPDARPADVVATVSVDGTAAHLTVADGSVWVATVASREVFRIDPATNAVTARVDVGYADELPGIAAGAGGVWLTNWLRDTVSRIDPVTHQVVATTGVGQDPAGGILVTDRDVWVTSAHDGTVSRVDTGTGAVVDTIELADVGDGGPQEVVAFDGRVLVAVPRDSEIAAVDPETGEISRFFTGRTQTRLAVTTDHVWTVEGGDATWVTRIGADGAADLRVGMGERRHPRALAASDDVLWVLTAGDESPTQNLELLRIDGPTGEVTDRQAVDHIAPRSDIVVDDVGDVWIAARNAVIRVDGAAG